MVFSNPYWDNKTKLELLAKWILVHSYLYYELDKSIAPDMMFDNNCRQFIQIAKLDKQAFIDHKYWYLMHDFDGSTGFHLPHRMKDEDTKIVMDIANRLVLSGGIYGIKRD